jgi:acyl carrier protein
VDNVGDKVREIIAVELRIDAKQIVPDSQLRSDLGMDSVAALNILFAAEQVFGIEAIEISEIAAVLTVGDIESLVRRYVADSAS